MNLSPVSIQHYHFEPRLFEELNQNRYAKDLWPLVYILSDEENKLAYVGETTNALARMSTHLKHHSKRRLTAVHLITSNKFNKSATLDIEANLIKYMAGDRVYRLLNGNLGLANHNYFQKKEVYHEVFLSIWNQLRAAGITRHSIEHIDNSDLFKYSPYKSLTVEQSEGLRQILQHLSTGQSKNLLVEGGAGTGKTILAIFLFKMLSTHLDDFSFREFGSEEKQFIHLVSAIRERFPTPEMALVVPMASFRATLKKVFRNIKGLNASMVIGPAEVTRNRYDILMVDESHRLRRRVNLGTYFSAFDKACAKLNLDKHTSSELDWMLMQSNHTILFYDQAQSIKPSDVSKEEFNRLKTSKSTSYLSLKSQFRVRGGNEYVEFVRCLLNGKLKLSDRPTFDNYEFKLFDSLEEMISLIKEKDAEIGLSRMIAGYAWEWKSKNNPDLFDIHIGEVKLRWNGTASDWINSENAVNEVGCIHTTQGYDLNYAGIIFGNEISYDPVSEEIIIREDHYYDRNGKQSIKDPKELKDFILNIYQTIMLRGIRGTFVYVCDLNLKTYLENYLPKPLTHSDSEGKLFLTDRILPFENAIPFYDLKVAAGNFSEPTALEGHRWVKLPKGIRPSTDLFACRVTGNSMNRIIPSDSVCLFRKYRGGSRNGLIVLAEHTHLQDDDLGSHYTVKEYESKKWIDQEGQEHRSISLKPRSYDLAYPVLELEDDELSTFQIVGVFERILGE